MRPRHSGTSVATLFSHTVFVLISCVLVAIPVRTAVYYCENGGISERIISGEENGTIHTLLQGQMYYGNSYDCRWIINAGSNTKKIQLTVISTNMQWAPESAICTEIYDNIIVRDGNNESSRIIIQWCGSRNPYSITSTGRNLSISFKTNSKNPYKYTGVHIKFEVFDAELCPPGWSSPSPSDPNCYSVKGHPEIWSDAQAFCNYEQGNLVSIPSQERQTYVNDLGKASGVPGGIAWIGLSKIASESTLEWIDDQPVRVKFFKSNNPADKDCVVMDFNAGSWTTKHCTRVKAAFVCLSLQRGKNILYEQPEAKKEVEEQSNIAILLAGVLGTLAVIVGIGAVILLWLKCRRNKPLHEPDRSQATVSQTDATPMAANSSRSQGRHTGRSMQRSNDPPNFSNDPPNYSQEMPAPPSYNEVIAEKFAT